MICKLLAFRYILAKQVQVETPEMCLNEEIVQRVSHTQIVFERCCLVKRCCDPSCKKQKGVTAVSDFDKGRIVAYRDCAVTSSREDRYVTCMVLMDRATTSRALSEELRSFDRQQVSARRVCRSMDYQLGGHGCGYP
ncbi:hypothetical protein TNCV_4232021 [Trichonephila clavipes]|nr:hypothetical protein TNCV_4232021 [Trichonephila clavipes]